MIMNHKLTDTPPGLYGEAVSHKHQQIRETCQETLSRLKTANINRDSDRVPLTFKILINQLLNL